MEPHFNLTDTEFVQQFENCSLHPDVFSHEAHLRLAWINIKRFSLDRAIQHISAHLMKYVAYVGARDKYNHTLTIAAIKAVYHFMNKSSKNNFTDSIIEFPRLKFNFRDLKIFIMESTYLLAVTQNKRLLNRI